MVNLVDITMQLRKNQNGKQSKNTKINDKTVAFNSSGFIRVVVLIYMTVNFLGTVTVEVMNQRIKKLTKEY